jgi:uncharacterized protein (DUF362 family)
VSTVLFRKAEYDYSILKPIIFEIIESIGGDKIQKGSHVIIKPNLLAPAPPEKAIVTHPLIIKTVTEYVIQRGATPQISDSPPMTSFEKVLKESGIMEALRGLKVECVEFKKSVFVDVGEPFKKIELAEDLLKADFIINLPKLKTHTHMLLTLGVKNLFGCIVGLKKPEWHFRVGIDRDMFASLLVKINQAINPDITIIDGILAMQGQGPGKRGEPRHLGVIMGSSNALAIDIAVCQMLGIDPLLLPTNNVAFKQGLIDKDINLDNDLPEIRDFKLPEMTPLVFGPERYHSFMRRHLVQRPECDDSLCRLCGDCQKYCPARAITGDRKRKIHFNYDKCIRCYCCIEICPHGALRARETLLGKIIRTLLLSNFLARD